MSQCFKEESIFFVVPYCFSKSFSIVNMYCFLILNFIELSLHFPREPHLETNAQMMKTNKRHTWLFLALTLLCRLNKPSLKHSNHIRYYQIANLKGQQNHTSRAGVNICFQGHIIVLLQVVLYNMICVFGKFGFKRKQMSFRKVHLYDYFTSWICTKLPDIIST